MNRVRNVVLTGAAAAALLLAPVGASAYGDAKGPPCADIDPEGTSVTYSSDGTTVGARVVTSAPSCASITYTLHITNEAGQELYSVSSAGTGYVDPSWGPSVFLEHTYTGTGPATIYVYLTSSRGDRLVDRGPDAGQLSLTPGASSGSRGMG